MNKNLKDMILAALFVAIIAVLGFTQLGILSIPPANVTIMHIPVIIGTLILGWKYGLVLGAAFGLTSVYKLLVAPSVLMTPLMGINPALPIAISIIARLMIPVTVWLVNMCFKKHKRIGIAVSAAAGTLANTVFYLGFLLLAYTICGLDSAVLLSTIAGVALLNGGCETAAALLICTPIVIAVGGAKYKTIDNKEEK